MVNTIRLNSRLVLRGEPSEKKLPATSTSARRLLLQVPSWASPPCKEAPSSGAVVGFSSRARRLQLATIRLHWSAAVRRRRRAAQKGPVAGSDSAEGEQRQEGVSA